MADTDFLLDALFRRTSDAMVVLDLHGRCTRANPAAGRLFGPDERELPGKVVSDLFIEGGWRPGQLAHIPADGDLAGRGEVLRADGSRRLAEFLVVRDAPGERFLATLKDVTEQDHAARALARSEQRLQLAQTAGRMGIWEWDVATGKITWTPELEAVYGLPPGSFSGDFEAYLALIHPGDRELVLEAITRLSQERRLDTEHRIFHPNGEERWLVGRGTLLSTPEGEPERAVGVGIDITEQKRMEESLRFIVGASRALASSLDYERTLAQVASLAVPGMADWCGVTLVDESGEPQQVAVAHARPENVAWAREIQRRYGPNRTRDRGPRRVIRTGESELISEIPDALIERIGLKPEERAILDRIGLVSYMCVPMTSRGRVHGAMTFISAESNRRFGPRDLEVAEHLAKRAAAAVENARVHREVERERARFASMIASVEMGVQQVDSAGRLMYMNPGAERLLGYTSEELAGEDFHDRVHSHAGTRDQCVVLAAAVQGIPFRGETSFRRKDGTLFPVEVTASPVFVGGAVEGAVVVYQDITERLEERRRKDDYLAFASHELRSPLTPIVGMARWLARRAEASGGFDEDTVGAIETLNAEAARMLRVVELFLDLSRLESGQVPLETDLLDMVAVTREEAGRIADQFEGAAVTFECAERRLVAESDEKRLRQVLANLLENGVKYGGPRPAVTVRLWRDGEDAVIDVHDFGPGIPADELPHVFERFFRGSSTEVRSKKGSGVGLFITRRLVELAGGSITVRSGAGEGTTFTVTWPLSASGSEGAVE